MGMIEDYIVHDVSFIWPWHPRRINSASWPLGYIVAILKQDVFQSYELVEF